MALAKSMKKGEEPVRSESHPLGEIVGEGRNAKYVKECTELHLGNKGFERLEGFERLTNLEVLWVNGNKLQRVANLDDNFRIRRLYAMDNRISTLKGSLLKFTFLEVLDLTNNNLRNLHKLLQTLGRFNFLTQLELKGNPCCEEPDYRLHVIHAVPSLHVLDLHVVTPAERARAEQQLGKGAVQATLCFGKRIPEPPEPLSMERGLEADLERSVARITLRRTALAEAEEKAAFGEETPKEEAKARSLPLPANWIPGKPPTPPPVVEPPAPPPVRHRRDVMRVTNYVQAAAGAGGLATTPQLDEYLGGIKPTIKLNKAKLATFREEQKQRAPLEAVETTAVRL
mmetsp:Transcript_13357/g.46215  ORF Transcript_13357/g.46215 Transcript_13357/m.46215 type:complete len:342 (+) Transcript_13357:94-1119(+)